MFTNVICSILGIVVALALTTQYHWGAWGLVASLLVFPPAGWILADWRNFLRALRKATLETLPGRIKKTGEVIRELWQEARAFHQQTKWGYLALLVASYALPVAVATEYFGVVPELAPGRPGGIFFFPFLSLVLLFFLGVIVLVLPSLFVDDYRYDVAVSIFRRGFTSDDKFVPPPYETLKNEQPKIWAEAEAATREWSWRVLRSNNPVVLFFVVLFRIGRITIEIAPALPGLGCRAVYQTGRLGCKLIKLTYLYANSDLRRIAAGSIATGMIIGFVVGYYLHEPLTGTLGGGAITGLVGWLQRELIYRPLVQRSRTNSN